MRAGLIVLGLHRVGRPPADATIRGLFTSAGLLKFQIRLLKLFGFEFNTISNAMFTPGVRTAVLTFDDGYEDNYRNGLPILQSEKVPATVFVIASDVGRRDVTWHEAGDKTSADMMSWDVLRELRSLGWEIGSHCDEHVHLAGRSAAEQKRLIGNGLRCIENGLGESPASFAYPYGSYDDSTIRVLTEFGVCIGVTTDRPNAGEIAPADDMLRVKRLSVGGWAWHHYVKVLIRTLRVVGAAFVFTVALETLTATLPTRTLTILSLQG